MDAPFLDFDRWDAENTRSSNELAEAVEFELDELLSRVSKSVEEEYGWVPDDESILDFLYDEITKRQKESAKRVIDEIDTSIALGGARV